MKKTKYTFLLCSVMVFLGCNSYEWDPEVKKLTGGNLKQWLDKAPFDKLWDIKGDNEDKMVMTNLKEVFPFYKGFKYENGKNVHRDSIYEDVVLIIKDSIGEGFVYAALLESKKKIELSESYFERGNVIFSGADSYKDSHNATLKKQFSNSHSKYISDVYYATVSHNYYPKNMVLCHYQKDRFLFQAVFVIKPRFNSETKNYEYDYQKIAQKIKAINAEMSLNIPEWENISISDLK